MELRQRQRGVLCHLPSYPLLEPLIRPKANLPPGSSNDRIVFRPRTRRRPRPRKASGAEHDLIASRWQGRSRKSRLAGALARGFIHSKLRCLFALIREKFLVDAKIHPDLWRLWTDMQ